MSNLFAFETYKLPGLDLPAEFIHPRYDGHAVLNIPSSICQLHNIPALEHPALHPDILSPLDGSIRNIILILMDALAYHRLQQWMADHPDLIWNKLAQDGRLSPITSITPSTTTAALTTFWTGASPAQHGVMGYEMWLKEYGVMTNMIELKPISYKGGYQSLTQAGFNPETFLPVDTLPRHLDAHGVATHVFQHYSIINSGLSRMFMAGAHFHPIGTPADLWVSMSQFLENPPTGRNYIWAYWGSVDGLSHTHGPDDPRPQAEFDVFSTAFERYFLNTLSPSARRDTALILTADHGQLTTDNLNSHFDLNNHPEFTRLLHMHPSGENRLTYLFIRPGQTQAVQDYIDNAWPDQFALIDPVDAVEKGLFGPGKPHPRLFDRIGDRIAVARGNSYWWWAAKDNPLIGRHGGLDRQEMIVPFLAVRL